MLRWVCRGVSCVGAEVDGCGVGAGVGGCGVGIGPTG